MARRQHGALNLEEISLGLEACIDNVGGLVGDANLLLDGNRPIRALTCLLVAGQELGKVQNLLHMSTISPEDSDGWKRFWRNFFNHKNKAAGGLLALLDPSTPADEVGRWGILFNSLLGGTAEQERTRTLYVDLDSETRSWVSPMSVTPELAETLLRVTEQAWERLMAARESGLHSLKALTIIQEVCASVPIVGPDPESPADAVEAAEYYEKLLSRNEIIRERRTQNGFDFT